MKLSEIFDQLTFGELSRVFIGGSEKKELDPASYEEIGAHINLALSALHNRFLLQEEEIRIYKYGNQIDYLISSDFARSNLLSTQPVKYVLDNEYLPFRDNIIKILAVYGPTGEELPLNTAGDDSSVYTPQFNKIQIPFGEHGEVYSILYRADHPRLVLDESTIPEQVEVNLPPSFLQALLYYVAARVVVPVGNSETGEATTNYLAKYEMECQRLAIYNLGNETTNVDMILERNGWV